MGILSEKFYAQIILFLQYLPQIFSKLYLETECVCQVSFAYKTNHKSKQLAQGNIAVGKGKRGKTQGI